MNDAMIFTVYMLIGIYYFVDIIVLAMGGFRHKRWFWLSLLIPFSLWFVFILRRVLRFIWILSEDCIKHYKLLN